MGQLRDMAFTYSLDNHFPIHSPSHKKNQFLWNFWLEGIILKPSVAQLDFQNSAKVPGLHDRIKIWILKLLNWPILLPFNTLLRRIYWIVLLFLNNKSWVGKKKLEVTLYSCISLIIYLSKNADCDFDSGPFKWHLQHSLHLQNSKCLGFSLPGK